jgi:hypothetical protein
MAPAVAPACCPTAPEESDSLLWTLSGGLSPPPVLGAGRSNEDDCKQVCLPSLAPSSQPHSPSARDSPRLRLSHSLLRASQFAMIAFHGPREHLAHPLAQLEILCIFICGSVGQSARAPSPCCVWRAIGSGVRVVARVPAPRHRFCACRPANTCVDDYFKCCR